MIRNSLPLIAIVLNIGCATEEAPRTYADNLYMVDTSFVIPDSLVPPPSQFQNWSLSAPLNYAEAQYDDIIGDKLYTTCFECADWVAVDSTRVISRTVESTNDVIYRFEDSVFYDVRITKELCRNYASAGQFYYKAYVLHPPDTFKYGELYRCARPITEKP